MITSFDNLINDEIKIGRTQLKIYKKLKLN